jgi:two-component system nitrogen regulation response regulator GlnG
MDPATILIADDDAAIRTVLTRALGRAGFGVRAAGDAATLWGWVEAGEGDLVITDVIMPDENGLDLVPRIRKARPGMKIVVMSAQSTLMTAVKATERGAFEYVPKPFDLDDVVAIVRRALETNGAEAAAEADAGDDETLPFIGRSPAMQDIYRTLARLMPTDLTVLITGESGTGKELVARALHDYGKRSAAPFVAVNMAAIPRELIESELFGHEKGAFTGATQRNLGRFEQARGGTLFLDEIGDMPMEAQTRLLRVLQEGEYTTVGGRTPLQADARIVAATHRDLRQLIGQGLFREDLYFRLNVVPIRLPALRERKDDIPELVDHFLSLAAREGLPRKTVSADGLALLRDHAWSGNVRELENLIRRLAALHSEDEIGAEAVVAGLSDQQTSAAPRPPAADIEGEGLSDTVERRLKAYFDAHGGTLPAAGLYDRVLREVERPLIKLTLKATRGNQLRAAELLGLNRNTLRKKIRELNIPIVRGGGG